MNLLRRNFLKKATYVGATATAIGSGVLLPQRVLPKPLMPGMSVAH